MKVNVAFWTYDTRLPVRTRKRPIRAFNLFFGQLNNVFHIFIDVDLRFEIDKGVT